MKTKRHLNRRRFLRVLTFMGIFAVTLPIRAIGKLCTYESTSPITRKLREYYVDQKSAKVIGREYLKLFPAEHNADVLIDLLCSNDVRKRTIIAQMPISKIRDLFSRLQCLDFEHGRVVKMRGWILSETECRLCALTALA